jgi:hypothetical protein
MRSKLNWVDVLNEQTRWYNRVDLKQWFAELAGRPVNVLEGTVEGFEEALGYMRRQVANIHFGDPVDLLWLDTQLKTVTLGLLHHQGAQEGDNSQMPHFRARVKGMHDTDLLRALKDTLLIQFAEYVGDTLDSESAGNVMRCEGLHKKSTGRPIAEVAAYPEQVESQWRDELSVVLIDEADEEEVQRCSYLFIGNPKGRYCSDACRFATLQITKQVQEPEYLVEKQRRYRRRNNKQA